MSDFNHQLSKIHEQFAEDSALLVEEFRKRTSDILNDGFVYILSEVGIYVWSIVGIERLISSIFNGGALLNLKIYTHIKNPET